MEENRQLKKTLKLDQIVKENEFLKRKVAELNKTLNDSGVSNNLSNDDLMDFVEDNMLTSTQNTVANNEDENDQNSANLKKN